MHNIRQFVIGLIFMFLAGCQSTTSTSSETKDSKGLKDYYKGYFPVGVAVFPKAMQGDQAQLIKTHFESMTPENVMKMGPIHPEADRYNWGPADTIVEFARANDLKMRGHALCWHNQTPKWIFVDEAGNDVSKEELLNRLQKHITEVVSRYKDDIYAWDVVNEAISDSKDEFYRNSKWYEICGEEFIAKAFEYARAADPDVELFYNDYEVINPVKREKIYQLVKGLKEAGVPIDGVGIQGHWSIYEPNEETLRATIERFTSLGLKVQITELDVSVYPKEHSRREKRATDVDSFTQEQQQLQAEQYEMIFRVFREYKNKLNAVTFWNISDKYSWLDHFPVANRKDYPLLFDENHEPKKAYYKITDF
ncbi:MAG: endo-1,4-beta-xylanase [Marinoscillum sp.]